MISVYDFKNDVRDVVPVLDYVNQNNPRLISFVGQGAEATNKTHEWTEAVLGDKQVTGTGSGNVITLDNAAGIAIGNYLQPVSTADVYIATAVAGNAVTVTKQVSGMADIPSGSTTYKVYGAATITGSKAGEEVFWEGSIKTNYCEIFRKDASLPGTALSTNTYDNASKMDNQVYAAMEALQSQLNFKLWHGRKSLGGKGTAATAGGLYEFCTKNIIDAEGEELSVALINELMKELVKAGAQPNAIVVSRNLAPAISDLYKDQVIIGENSTVRGQYVSKIKTAYGQVLDVIYDDQVPTSHLWIMELGKIKLSPMAGRAFADKDSTLPGFDGESRTIIGEYTFEIYNADECFGRIEKIG